MNDWTIIKILSWTESYFQKHAIDSPRLTAEILLAYCLDIKRLDLYLQHDRPLNQDELSDFKAVIRKRTANQPLAYITGEKGFFEADFKITNDVLIPRPDTETIVEQALKILNKDRGTGSMNILELGTGSGAIIISLAKENPHNQYFAGDLSSDALAVAKKNSEEIVNNRINFFCTHWLSSIKASVKFDLIVSNPPYIPSGDISKLQPEIKDFEPMLALDGGEDGLDSIRLILKKAHFYLVPEGVILLEIGFDQKEGVLNIIKKYSQYQSMKFIKDFSGHTRVAIIKKSAVFC